jgi:hypothetical protein
MPGYVCSPRTTAFARITPSTTAANAGESTTRVRAFLIGGSLPEKGEM